MVDLDILNGMARRFRFCVIVLFASLLIGQSAFAGQARIHTEMVEALEAYAYQKMGQHEQAFIKWMVLAEKGNAQGILNVANAYQDGTDALERSVRAKVGKQDTGTVSDARLKRDIHHVATREDGLRLYAFKYLWDEAVHVGVMAQDLLRKDAWRSSVSSESGYYTVNYGLLGLRMTTLDEWEAKGLAALKA